MRKFSYFPAPYILLTPLAATIFISAVLLTVKVKNASSILAMLLYALVAVGTFVFALFALAYFKRPWRYWVDDHTLAADRLWGRDRVEIPWSQVTGVRKAIRRDRFRNWPEIEVHAADGATIVIPSNLRKYTELVEIIRERATNCRQFEVYPSWRLGARPSAKE